MKKWRRLLLVGAMGLAVVLALAVTGSALAAGWWGPTYVAQAQAEPGSEQAWTCPMAGDEATAQAMTEAMRSGDFDRMQELMGEGFGGMMSGWDADAIRDHMQGVDFDRMQELMRNGDWQGMRDYMDEQGVESWQNRGQGFGPGMMGGYRYQAPNTDSSDRPAPAPANGGAATRGGWLGDMMNGSQGSMMGGNWGGMMGRR